MASDSILSPDLKSNSRYGTAGVHKCGPCLKLNRTVCTLSIPKAGCNTDDSVLLMILWLNAATAVKEIWNVG